MSSYNWRIALTEAGLSMGPLVSREIPIPTTWDYNPWAVEIVRSDGGVATHGYRNAEALWETMTPYQFFALKDLIDDARASAGGLIYMTVPLIDGSTPGVKWVDISGLPFLGQPRLAHPLPSASSYMYKDILLKLNDITIEEENPTF